MLDLAPTLHQIRIHQGDDMGRPSLLLLLLVDIPDQGGIEVTGSASQI
jgi:predicted PhzF superfamily epimerase YddE/YHI9